MTIRAWVLACLWGAALCMAGAVPGPSTTGAAGGAARSAKARIAQAESLLSKKTATFNFVDAPVDDILSYIADSYGITVARHATIEARVTMKLPNPLTAREALGLLNDTLLPMGYVALQSVSGNPQRVALEITATTADPKTVPPVYWGANPAEIPNDLAARTQVIQLADADPEAVQAAVRSLLKQAVIKVSPATGRIYITDSALNIRLAAEAIALMEQRAAPDGPAAGSIAPANGATTRGR